MWNSSMDSQLKLAQTYAMKYDSPEVPSLPKWAIYKGLAYGTTYEPAVFLYNKRLIKDSEVPQTHADLAKLVGSQGDRFKNKVTTYDIEKSAVGFMMAAQDNQDSPQYFDFIKAVGPNLVLQSSTGTMMERVASGENLIAYNILGSYALARAKKDPSIGIVYPKDYTLVVSRVAMIAKKAKNPNAAKLWLDYILSKRGQDILAIKSDLHSLRDDVTGEATAAGLKKILGNTIKPIPVDESILTFLEPKKRLDFIKQWRTAAGR
jgi:iron(III) transport system substrate-binding protein